MLLPVGADTPPELPVLTSKPLFTDPACSLSLLMSDCSAQPYSNALRPAPADILPVMVCDCSAVSAV